MLRKTFLFAVFLILIASCTSSYQKKKTFAEQYWGNERTCLPCHEYQQPIARRHNYRCDTCHRGNPFAEDKEKGHENLIKIPQDEEFVKYTCHKCHLLTLQKTVPYDSDFVKDVLLSHK
jgi:hypothetical protein